MPTPLTVEFIGTRADAAQAITDYTATKITGGGPGPAESLASLFKQGDAAVAMDYPAADKLQFLSFDDGGTTSFDFTSGGANEGQLIWVWGNASLLLLPLEPLRVPLEAGSALLLQTMLILQTLGLLGRFMVEKIIRVVFKK